MTTFNLWLQFSKKELFAKFIIKKKLGEGAVLYRFNVIASPTRSVNYSRRIVNYKKEILKSI
jgi:hypothetical protein